MSRPDRGCGGGPHHALPPVKLAEAADHAQACPRFVEEDEAQGSTSVTDSPNTAPATSSRGLANRTFFEREAETAQDAKPCRHTDDHAVIVVPLRSARPTWHPGLRPDRAHGVRSPRATCWARQQVIELRLTPTVRAASAWQGPASTNRSSRSRKTAGYGFIPEAYCLPRLIRKSLWGSVPEDQTRGTVVLRPTPATGELPSA
jgi:hypothetical protein